MKRNHLLTWSIAVSVVLFLFVQSRIDSVSALLVAGLIAIPTLYGGMLWKSISRPGEIKLELSTLDNET